MLSSVGGNLLHLNIIKLTQIEFLATTILGSDIEYRYVLNISAHFQLLEEPHKH